MTIGFVGAGRMGMPMVRRLVDAGEDVRVLVRSDSSAEAVRESGATPERSIDDVVRAADAVILCVHKDEQVREICFENGLLDAMSAGSVLVVHTTGSPHTVQEIDRSLTGRDIVVVDAPVSGGPDDIEAGRITVFIGGSRTAVADAIPIVALYADPVRHVGPLGSGQSMKLVNNAVFLSNIEIITAATRFGIELGMDESMMIDCLRAGSADSYALAGVQATGGAEAFGRSVAEFLNKDIDVVRAVASATGADLGPIAPLLRGARSRSM